jgi:VanZ family protein
MPVRWPERLQAWWPVLACVAALAIESTPYFGSDRTSAPLQRIAEALFGVDIAVDWGEIHHTIRKTGHFLGFGAFSLVCFRGFWLTFQNDATRLRRKLCAHGLAILISFLAAGADELHQCFLPNRSGEFKDVVLDTFGAAVLGFALFLVMLAVERLAGMRAKRMHRQVSAYVE